ncbi:hypothetical protein DEM26_17415 [Thioclava sp. NG1]|uniref:hypothetical protein n=1 Tax=Thioclava sp. NG1 TaxID=2182426 RepID=UPI000D617216|nr:hypothetical protein [Thioclava sp. NG1]PWE48579.1 hypothetical protein DEM26_17415 [Thioclava sp. NG1]
MMARKFFAATFICLFPGVLLAQEITETECAELGTTLQILAKQNLRISEIRQGIASDIFSATVKNSPASMETVRILEGIATKLDDSAVDATDLLPGIRVYRRLCRD